MDVYQQGSVFQMRQALIIGERAQAFRGLTVLSVIVSCRLVVVLKQCILLLQAIFNPFAPAAAMRYD